MPKIADYDRQALAALLGKQHGVVTREQARECGMSLKALRYRSKTGGPWQVPLPGVFLAHTGTPTQNQRAMAALLYAGPRSVLTGPVALRMHRLRAPRTDTVDVLVPLNTQRRDAAFVRLHRTSRLPELHFFAGELRFVPPARAVADTVCRLNELSEARAVAAAAVQLGRCSIGQLVEELTRGPRRESAQFRRVLGEVVDGIRSSAEGDLHDLIKRAHLPTPMFNPRLFVGSLFLAQPDAWWPDAAVAAEVDSRAWHLSPGDWERTLARHARMSSYGIIVLHFTPGQIGSRRAELGTTIRNALEAGRNRPLPQIRALPVC